MRRVDALQLGSGTLFALAAKSPAAADSPNLTLPYFAFAVGIGTERGVGVLFDDPILVVEDNRAMTKRLTIPRADFQSERRWLLAAEPAEPPATNVSGLPASNGTTARISDSATALCRGTGGVYIAMLAFPTRPYLVHYEAEKNEFRTYALPSSQPVHVVFQSPGRLNYILAGSIEVRSAELAVSDGA